MAKKYQEIPLNFSDFEGYIIHKNDEVISKFIEAHKYFFYDTCSIMHHSQSNNKNTIISYLRSKADTIIITRTVLMELTANSFELHPVQIQFIKDLYDNNFKIILFDEELIFDCLRETLSISIEDANKLFGYAVKEISRAKTTTYEILNSIDKPISDKLRGPNPCNRELFTSFFQYARSKKDEGDSLAEELILICIIVLTRIPSGYYILISDDLRIRSLVISVNDYILKNHNIKALYQLTTASLIYKMFKEGILVNKDKMIEIIQRAFTERVNVFFVGEYDLRTDDKTFDCEELIDKILNDNQFRVVY